MKSFRLALIRIARGVGRGSLAAALLCCCSCQWAGTSLTTAALPLLQAQAPARVEPATSQPQVDVRTTQPATSTARIYTLSSFDACEPTGTCTIDGTCTADSCSPGATTSGDTYIGSGLASDSTLSCSPQRGGDCYVCQGADQGMAAIYSDEYLCDGGDQATHVSVNRNWEVYGLDPEDTVAHYDTLDGRTVVTPSNSVCIYAPRFGAARKIVRASEDDLLLAMQTVEQPLPAITDDQTNRLNVVDQPLPVQRDLSLAGPLALRARTRGLEYSLSLPVHELVNDFAAHEDFQVIRTGIERRSQRVDVEKYEDAAIVWTDNLQPEVMLDAEPAEIDVTVEKVGTEYHIGPEGTPRIRVIKLASTDAAAPGEEVTFTLRFDNVGDQTIGNVTILDNLTTRLEYVPDSAECSLKAEFFHEPNAGHSLALRWEIRDPINPGDGGVIRFRCKVR
ncbi:MAG: DUF11 domain-containing protein [Planctomycetales bacterium]|nr:DUF11 domain-containing protein [Planctomycetales bacterium]